MIQEIMSNKFLVLVLSIVLVSCGNSDPNSEESLILGRWSSYESTTANGDTLLNTGIRTTTMADLEFRSNKTVKDYTTQNYFYTYRLNGDTLILGEKEYLIVFQGADTLIMKERKDLLGNGGYINYFVRY